MVVIAFVGVTTFDKPGTGASSIFQAVIWVSPKRQLRNVTLALLALITLLAQLREAAVHALSSQTLAMTYRILGTQVSLRIGVRTWAKSPFMCG
jgi:hypothetical protein